SNKPTMSLFLYYSFFYFVWTFSGIRQGFVLAVGIYYYLVTFEENKSFKFILINLVLSLIHTSVLILLPMYFISKIHWTQKRLLVLSVIVLLFSVLPVGRILSIFAQIPMFNQALNYISTDYSINKLFDIQ